MKPPFVILSRKKYLSFSPSSEIVNWKKVFDESQQKIIQQQNQIKELNIQIRNFNAGALELQQEQISHKEIITSLKIKNKGLEEMVKEQEKIINEKKHAWVIPVSEINSERDKQILNLKTKIAELEKEIEVQKQITHSKNQELNKLKCF